MSRRTANLVGSPLDLHREAPPRAERADAAPWIAGIFRESELCTPANKGHQ